MKRTHIEPYVGGTGNLYDGVPERMVRLNPPLESDTLLGFEYDDRKRLSVVTYYHRLLTYSVETTNTITYQYNEHGFPVEGLYVYMPVTQQFSISRL